MAGGLTGTAKNRYYYRFRRVNQDNLQGGKVGLRGRAEKFC